MGTIIETGVNLSDLDRQPIIDSPKGSLGGGERVDFEEIGPSEEDLCSGGPFTPRCICG